MPTGVAPNAVDALADLDDWLINGNVRVTSSPKVQLVAAGITIGTVNQGNAGTAAQAWYTRLVDSGGVNVANVSQFHNSDNQALGTVFGLLTGGVAQLLNVGSNLDRARETGTDNITAVGVPAGTQQLKSPISTTVTAGGGAGSTSVTLNATKFTNRGAQAWIGVGSVLAFEPGTTNQEFRVVTAVNYSTNVVTVAALTNTHANTSSATSGAYNEARDATTADGSTGTGFAAGATYLLNGTLNSGSGGWEGERSAAGELDGATGAGTAIAAEYEWNGNPLANANVLSGMQFDRARNLNAKGFGSGTISNNPLAANSTTLTLNAGPTTLIPGQKILLDRVGANPETNYVGTGYTAGSTTVPLQIATQFSHAQNSTVEWDQHAALGPQLSGFLPDGVGIEEEALWDPVSQKFYIERSATQDGQNFQNVVMECVALDNGGGVATGADRWKSASSSGAGLGVGKVAPTPTGAASTAPNNNTTAAAAASAVVKASAGVCYGASGVNPAAATRFIMFFDAVVVPADGAVTPAFIVQVPANTGWSYDAGTFGRKFTTGIVWAASTTGPFTKTLEAAAQFVDTQFV